MAETTTTTTTTTTRNWPLIRIYAAVITRGSRTVESVPEKYRTDVQDFMGDKLADNYGQHYSDYYRYI